MSRTLQNLYRLRRKMQARYGYNDELILQLDREIVAHEVADAQLAMPAAVSAGRFSPPRASGSLSMGARH